MRFLWVDDVNMSIWHGIFRYLEHTKGHQVDFLETGDTNVILSACQGMDVIVVWYETPSDLLDLVSLIKKECPHAVLGIANYSNMFFPRGDRDFEVIPPVRPSELFPIIEAALAEKKRNRKRK